MAEKKLKNTTKTPPQTKKSIENSMPHFHSEIWLQSVTFLLRMVQCWKKPSLLSLLAPILWEVVEGQQAMGESTPGYLVGCQTVLSPSSRTPQNPLVPPVPGEQREQSPQNTENWNVTARSQDIVLLQGLSIWD